MSEQLQLRRGTVSQVAGFTGAAGEVVADTTNNRLVLNDGVTARRRAARKAIRGHHQHAHGRLRRRLHGFIYRSHGRLHRAHSLRGSSRCRPPARIRPGRSLLIIDESGTCSVTKTLTVNAAGTDHIDGAISAVVNQAYGYIEIESNGVGAWTISDQGFMPATVNLAAAAHGASIQMQVLETDSHPLGRFHQRFGTDPGQLHRPGGWRPCPYGNYWRHLL